MCVFFFSFFSSFVFCILPWFPTVALCSIWKPRMLTVTSTSQLQLWRRSLLHQRSWQLSQGFFFPVLVTRPTEKTLTANQYPSDVTPSIYKAEETRQWRSKYNEKNTFHCIFDRHLICQPSTSVALPAQLETHYVPGASRSCTAHLPTLPPRFTFNWLKQLQTAVWDTRTWRFLHRAGGKASSAIKRHSSILSCEVAVRPTALISRKGQT